MKWISCLILIFISSSVNLSLSAQSINPDKKKVLSGMIIRYGDLVDSIRPIYGVIGKNGKIEDLTFAGKQVGGNGGTEKIILKNGYVIVGFYLDKGDYFGATHISKLRIIWQKWNRHKPEGELVLSESFGSGNNLNYFSKLELLAPAGFYIYSLNARSTTHSNGDDFLSDIQFETQNESFKKDMIGTSINMTPSVTYNFEVEIISGFNKGKTANGIFSYNSFDIKREGEEFVEVSEIEFTYDKDKFTRSSFDSVPKVRFVDGVFKGIYFTGGQQTKRFGINTGFNRNQFGREEENFILKGGDYFGYLNPETYVEGAGKVKYKLIVENVAK